jgi:hypothetical protein
MEKEQRNQTEVKEKYRRNMRDNRERKNREKTRTYKICNGQK